MHPVFLSSIFCLFAATAKARYALLIAPSHHEPLPS